MRSALPLFLTVCLAITPAAGCATARGPRQLNTRSGAVPRALAGDWSRVQQIPAGAAIRLATRGLAARPRFFVLADAATVVALNVEDVRAPARAVRVLRRFASTDPQRLASLRVSGAMAEDDVRLGRDGLFVAGSRIADYDQVVEAISRADVLAIRGPVVARGSGFGVLAGGYLGLSVGAVPALGGAPGGIAWLALFGGTIAGGWLGYRVSSHQTEGLVYESDTVRYAEH